MRVIGRDDLADDPDLQTNAGRWRRRDELDDAIAAWTRRHARAEALAILDEAGVPSGPIYNAADICADEQYKERNMIQYFDVDAGDGARPVGFPGIVPVVGGASLPIRSRSAPTSASTPDEVLSRCRR